MFLTNPSPNHPLMWSKFKKIFFLLIGLQLKMRRLNGRTSRPWGRTMPLEGRPRRPNSRQGGTAVVQGGPNLLQGGTKGDFGWGGGTNCLGRLQRSKTPFIQGGQWSVLTKTTLQQGLKGLEGGGQGKNWTLISNLNQVQRSPRTTTSTNVVLLNPIVANLAIIVL